MIDTARIIITTKCNLNCEYCCNNIPEVNRYFKNTKLEDINFDAYKNICITGGEPMLSIDRIFKVLDKSNCKNVYLYTNGLLLNRYAAKILTLKGVTAFNIGIHDINNIPDLHIELKGFNVRFLLDEKYSYLILPPSVQVKFYKMNECFMVNEDWYLLNTND